MGLDLDAFLADVIVNECKLRKEGWDQKDIDQTDWQELESTIQKVIIWAH